MSHIFMTKIVDRTSALAEMFTCENVQNYDIETKISVIRMTWNKSNLFKESTDIFETKGKSQLLLINFSKVLMVY